MGALLLILAFLGFPQQVLEASASGPYAGGEVDRPGSATSKSEVHAVTLGKKAVDLLAEPAEGTGKLSPGKRLLGRLGGEGSGRLVSGEAFELYRRASSPGMGLHVTVSSPEFDPLVLVVGPDGLVVSANDDENPKIGAQAGATFFPGVTGEYEVWVTATDGGSGRYSILLEETSLQTQTGPLAIGDAISGWLGPGDGQNRKGLFRDRWQFTMPSIPVGLWARSESLDVYIKILSAEGTDILWTNDLDPIGGDRSALLFLDPETLGAGRELQIEVGSFGPAAIGPYSLDVQQFPVSTDPPGFLPVRLLRVRGEDSRGGSQTTGLEVAAAFERSKAIWKRCGIKLVLDEGAWARPLEVPGLDQVLKVGSDSWSEEETRLLGHPARLSPEAGGVTVYVVGALDNGEAHGLSYPPTRYSPRRVGVIISDGAVQRPDKILVLAHEIGHMLGLVHSYGGDGDPRNDQDRNLMFIAEADRISTVGDLSPFQCAVARRSPHLLRYPKGGRPTELFRAKDRLLVLGHAVEGSLADGDSTLPEGALLDLYYFEGEAGDVIRLRVVSDAFDPFLVLETADGERIGTDDDGGLGTTALLEVSLPVAGDFVVGVTSPRSESRGRYSLLLETVGPSIHPPGAAPSVSELPPTLGEGP